MSLRMRVLPRFPANISGINGITTSRDGPDLVIKSDYGSLVRIPAVDNEATSFFKVWNQDDNSYSVMTFEDVIAAIGTITGFMEVSVYDPQGKNADAFARANHTGTQAISTVSGLQAALDAKLALNSPLLRGFISPGFNLANNATDATNDIDFPGGQVASEAAAPLLMDHAAGTAQLDVAYGPGTGGRFDSAISDGWWHCFIISDGSSVRRGFSKALVPTAAPNYPSGYTHYRRVGSIFRASGAIKAFSQRGDVVLYSTVVSDLAAVSVGTTAQLPILTVPTGISVTALFNASMLSNTLGTLVLISSPFQAAVGANATAGNFSLYVPVNNVAGVGTFAILTNPSGQVLVVSSATAATCTLNIATHGYIDTRGRT